MHGQSKDLNSTRSSKNSEPLYLVSCRIVYSYSKTTPRCYTRQISDYCVCAAYILLTSYYAHVSAWLFGGWQLPADAAICLYMCQLVGGWCLPNDAICTCVSLSVDDTCPLQHVRTVSPWRMGVREPPPFDRKNDRFANKGSTRRITSLIPRR